MKAYRFITGTRIAPFGDQVSESQIGDSRLGLVVTTALEQAGLLPCRGEPGRLDTHCLALPDTIFITRRTIEEFLRACPRGEGIFRLALRAGPLTQWLCPLSNVDMDDNSIMFHCYIIRGHVQPASSWEELRQRLSESAQPVILDPGTRVETIPIPIPSHDRTEASSLTYLPRTALVAADISHWVHLLWLNQLIPWLKFEESRGRKGTKAFIAGKHCDIHPTAMVENSVLGNRVKIGPFASVIDCVLGDRVELSESSRMKRCCVGHGCRTLPDSYFIGCTFYPASTLANFMLRESIVGRGSFITSGLVFSSSKISETIKVKIDGKYIDTGRRNLGSAVGHGCTLGTLGKRGSIAPGTEIPNGYMIVMKPGDGLQSLPKNPGPLEAFMNVNGTATPVAKRVDGTKP